MAPVPDLTPADPLVWSSLVITEVPSMSRTDVGEGQTGEVTFRVTNLTAETVDLLGPTLVGSTFPDPAGGMLNTFVTPGGCLQATLMPGQQCLYQQMFQSASFDSAGGPLLLGTSMLYNRVTYQVMGNPVQIGNAFGLALVNVSDSPVPELPTGLCMWIGLLSLPLVARRSVRRAP